MMDTEGTVATDKSGKMLATRAKAFGQHSQKKPWARIQGQKGVCRSCFMPFIMLLGCLSPFLFLFK